MMIDPTFEHEGIVFYLQDDLQAAFVEAIRMHTSSTD
jgi:hypothetical protein